VKQVVTFSDMQLQVVCAVPAQSLRNFRTEHRVK